jgi:hypothetical protein
MFLLNHCCADAECVRVSRQIAANNDPWSRCKTVMTLFLFKELIGEDTPGVHRDRVPVLPPEKSCGQRPQQAAAICYCIRDDAGIAGIAAMSSFSALRMARPPGPAPRKWPIRTTTSWCDGITTVL